MNRDDSSIPSRADAWKQAAWYALLGATAVLILLKLFTGIVFMAALSVAIALFVIFLAFIMRLTPHR